jgi:hypothetical protein
LEDYDDAPAALVGASCGLGFPVRPDRGAILLCCSRRDVCISVTQEKYLKERIKVGGKAGNLGDAVTVGTDKSKITVQAEGSFSKRYLKYLAKKYLKKNQVLRQLSFRVALF